MLFVEFSRLSLTRSPLLDRASQHVLFFPSSVALPTGRRRRKWSSPETPRLFLVQSCTTFLGCREFRVDRREDRTVDRFDRYFGFDRFRTFQTFAMIEI